MAVASLMLSFFAFIPPLGIAAAVMGHIARGQIAKSRGRLIGTWFAFAGLVITYLQFAVLAIVCIVIVGGLQEMNRNLDRGRHTRAALVAAIYSYHRRTDADYTRQRRDVVDALRLIDASQADYLAANEGYACQLWQLNTVTPTEVNMHIVNSHYEVKIDQCRGADAQRPDDRAYVAVAIPRSEWNPADAPVYCIDQNRVIRRYSPATDLNRIVLFEHKSCPDSGEPVE
jgi:uncharacterized protein DUF4190